MGSGLGDRDVATAAGSGNASNGIPGGGRKLNDVLDRKEGLNSAAAAFNLIPEPWREWEGRGVNDGVPDLGDADAFEPGLENVLAKAVPPRTNGFA